MIGSADLESRMFFSNTVSPKTAKFEFLQETNFGPEFWDPWEETGNLRMPAPVSRDLSRFV